MINHDRNHVVGRDVTAPHDEREMQMDCNEETVVKARDLTPEECKAVGGGMALAPVPAIYKAAKESTGGNGDMSSWGCP